MASASLDPTLPAPTRLRIVARVGAARWTVLLAAPAVALLRAPHLESTTEPLPRPALDRVMEWVRRRALKLRWYGGGTLSIEAADLADPTPAGPSGDAPEKGPAQWYAIVEISAVGHRGSGTIH